MTEEDELVPGSMVRRWRLGKQLRELRENAHKSMDEAAAYLGVKRPTISRIENGRHAILPKNVRFLCQLYDVGSPLVDMLVQQADESNERGWWVSYSNTMPDWFETFVGFEADAREIWTYESELIPGLLQIPEYVRALRAVEGPATEAQLAKSVEFRLARQQRLQTRPPRLRVVLNEAVLRRQVGGPAAAAEQFRHLVEISAQPWATIQVLPFDAGPHRSMKGSFSLLTLPDETDPNFVYLEHIKGAVYLERPADLARYASLFEHLTDEVAISPEASRKLLVTLIREYSGE
jgi:transcriptional regulator with XRE-family HTH domain